MPTIELPWVNLVSACCHREIVSTTKLEYPLGGRQWHQAYKVDVCECCGKEVDDSVEACGYCGLTECDCK